MAFGITSFFKLGVAVSIPNYRFIFGDNLVGTLTADRAEDDTSIGITHSYADLKNMITAHSYLHTFQDQADTIIIGPSTNVNNLNAIEGWIIDSVDTNSVTLLSKAGETGLRYKYNAGDPVSMTAGQWPAGGWTTNNLDGSGNNKIDVKSLNQFDPTRSSFFGDKAWYDDYAFSFGMWSSETFGVNTPEVKLPLGDILTPAIYRWGVGYRAFENLEGDLVFEYKVEAGIGNTLSMTNQSFTPAASRLTIATDISNATWQESSIINTLNSPTKCDLLVRLFNHTPGTLVVTFNQLGYMYLEHAKGTSTESGGVYTFTNMPRLGSTGYTFRETSDEHIGLGYKSKRFNWFGFFEDVPSRMFKDLMILDYYQDLGNKMFFHTNEEYGSNLPPVIKGNFKISGLTQSHWDSKRFSFRFDFIEE